MTATCSICKHYSGSACRKHQSRPKPMGPSDWCCQHRPAVFVGGSRVGETITVREIPPAPGPICVPSVFGVALTPSQQAALDRWKAATDKLAAKDATIALLRAQVRVLAYQEGRRLDWCPPGRTVKDLDCDMDCTKCFEKWSLAQAQKEVSE